MSKRQRNGAEPGPANLRNAPRQSASKPTASPGANRSETPNRWKISGPLTLTSALHVGDGAERYFPGRLSKETADDTNDQVLVQTVCVDHNEKPLIPGASLKGSLRAATEALLTQRYPRSAPGDDNGTWLWKVWEDLFGSRDSDAKEAVGGKLEFWDARWPQTVTPAASTRAIPGGDREALPFYDTRRQTCVATSVSLDRKLRSAKEHLLFHVEYVPAGSSFDCTFTIQNATEEEVGAFLILLRELNADSSALRFGAFAVHGWGRARWAVESVSCFSRTSLQRAIEKGTLEAAGYALCTERVHHFPLLDAAERRIGKAQLPEQQLVHVRASFAGPVLVRDPARAKARNAGNTSSELVPDARSTVTDQSGQYMIPARSVRGAFRSQAERILRTLGVEVRAPSDIRPEHTENAINSRTLDPACGLFGAPGWKGALTITDWTASSGRTLRQEFVAIDRFTGGAAEQKKFSAEAVLGGTFEGSFAIDRARCAAVLPRDMAAASAEEWGLGLLCFLLRDLIEGDICLGSGAAKGYGVCTGLQLSLAKEGPFVEFEEFAATNEAAKAVNSFSEYLKGLNR